MSRSRVFLLVSLTVLAVYFLLFLIFPTLYVVIRSVVYPGQAVGEPDRFYLGFYVDAFTDVVNRWCLINSLLLGITVTLLTTVVALPLALATVKRDFPGKTWVHVLVLLPMIMPPFVGGVGLRQMLARGGSVNILLGHVLTPLSSLLVHLGVLAAPWSTPTVDWLNLAPFWGVVFLEVLHLYPIMYLNVVASLANVDTSLEEAARSLGDSPWNVLRRVTFPLMLPGYFAGASIVFIWAFTDLGAPLVLNYPDVIPKAIYDMRTQPNARPVGYVLVMMTLVITVLFYLAARRLLANRHFSMMSKGVRAVAVKRASTRLTLLIYAGLALLTMLALLPHFAVVLAAFAGAWEYSLIPSSFTLANFARVFDRDYTVLAILNSLRYSAGASVLVILLGVLIAYLLVRKRFPGAQILDALTMLPLALPGIVLAFGFLTTYYDLPFIGIGVNPAVLIIVAYSMRRLPYMVRASVAGFQQVSPTLEEASVNLGASPFRTLRRITVPLLLGNLVAGALLTFVFSMFEVSASLMLLQYRDVYSFAPALLSVLQDHQRGVYEASAFGMLGMIVLGLSLVLASRFLGKRMGEIFRI